jgi:hypothetical protein
MRIRRALVAVIVAVATMGVGCGPQSENEAGGADGRGGGGGDGPSSSSSAPGGTGSPDVDGRYTVPAPGPREGPVTVADILVTSQETIPEDVVDEIKKLPGVAAVAAISVVNVPIENKGYTLAAVDPDVYRRFVVATSADFGEQWKRVAGGEIAVADALKEKLPTDGRGYVGLPVGDEMAKAHVGAYAPQVENIDMVVNDAFGEALGVVPGNALLINTGATSPSTLRDPIIQAVGPQTSVQNLDAVARFGLDPDAVQSAVLVGSFADAVGVFNYTPIGGGRIAPDPAWVRSHIVTEEVPILGAVTCNKYLMPQLRAAFQEIVTAGLADKINPGEYAGCYYPRFIAGSTKLSNHSYGLALDLNVPGNQRGTVGEMDRTVVAIFKKWGFAWGGDWNYTDPMHFELDRLVKPGS